MIARAFADGVQNGTAHAETCSDRLLQCSQRIGNVDGCQSIIAQGISDKNPSAIAYTPESANASMEGIT